VSTMLDTAAKTALDDFEEDIGRVEQLLRLIHIFRDFAGQAVELSGHAQDLYEMAQSTRTDLPILSGSLLLYMCGRFEYFVRELVGTIVDDLVDKAATYEDLPLALRKEALTRTLQINLNPSKFNHGATSASVLAAQLAANLSSRSDGSPTIFVDSSTITITESNMRPDVLVDLFKRVGISSLWDTLGKQLTLKSFLEEATDEGCKKAAMARLDDIMSERNKVAHPIGDAAFPDATSVEKIAHFFRALAQVLVDLALAPR
jgi:HEPN superfamily RiboL-PSP-like protein